MAENNQTPNDFGLAVKQHPDSALQITARNKQKNVREFVFNMNLDGQFKETAWLSENKEDKDKKYRSAVNTIFEGKKIKNSICRKSRECTCFGERERPL